MKEQAVNDFYNIVKIKLQEKSMHAMHKTADTDFWNHVNMFSELAYWLSDMMYQLKAKQELEFKDSQGFCSLPLTSL